MSTKRKNAKKKLMEAKRALKQEQKKAYQKQQEEVVQSRWLDQNHWNYPNSYVALAFLAYNGLETQLSVEQIRELKVHMYENIKSNNNRSYWTYSCGYYESDLWDYDRERQIFTRKPTTSTLDLVCYVVGVFDRTQLEAVFPSEAVQELLVMKLEEDRKEAVLRK